MSANEGPRQSVLVVSLMMVLVSMGVVTARAQAVPTGGIIGGLPEMEWGLPIFEVEQRLAPNDATRTSDGELVFPGEVAGMPAQVNLTFHESVGGLFSVVATVDRSTSEVADRIIDRLMTLHGEPSAVETRSERRMLFFKFDTTLLMWDTVFGAITYINVRHGSDIVGLSVIYSLKRPD